MPMQSPGGSARGFTNSMSPLNRPPPTPSPATNPSRPSLFHRTPRKLCHGGRMDTPETAAVEGDSPADPGLDAEHPQIADYTGDWPGRAASLITLRDQLGERAERIEHIGEHGHPRHGGQGRPRSSGQRGHAFQDAARRV